MCDVKGLCGEIQRRMAETNGFEIGVKTILGNFAFQKMAMVKDLQDRAGDLATHSVIAAIAGDGEAKTEVNAGQTGPNPKEFDTIPPENEFSVLDADSSQQSAIASVLAGQSRVIHGPPGTGKSQTITNLIASLAATGQRVLFVAEKKAALDVVKHRLEEVVLDTWRSGCQREVTEKTVNRQDRSSYGGAASLSCCEPLEPNRLSSSFRFDASAPKLYATPA